MHVTRLRKRGANGSARALSHQARGELEPGSCPTRDVLPTAATPVTRVQDAPDHRAPIIETLEPMNLSDALDLVVAGVREHDMSPKVGTWSQLQTPRLRAKSSSTITVLSYPIQSRLMGSSGPLRLRSASFI